MNYTHFKMFSLFSIFRIIPHKKKKKKKNNNNNNAIYISVLLYTMTRLME